jgi:ferredoxin
VSEQSKPHATGRVPHGELIPAAARRAGLELPRLCEQGWRTTGAVRVLTGRVDQSASRRFFEADRAAGFALICTGWPVSDLRLQPCTADAVRAHRDAHRLPVPRGMGSRWTTSLRGDS